MYIHRLLEKTVSQVLESKKSILLLGPRQTGKTTLLGRLATDKYVSLANLRDRLRYEKEPATLAFEIEQLATEVNGRIPLIVIDEIQKIPLLMDAVQDLIDRKIAQFILTGSSARKLRRREQINLLPGRVIPLRLDPLTHVEILAYRDYPLINILLDGTLPDIVLEKESGARETLLDAYVSIYLEEEIRAEALVRDLGSFARFLELAAAESGKIINFTKLSKQIGVTHPTVIGYYRILEDCLAAERIEPVTEHAIRKKLSKAPKYLFYDLGVRRIAAHEGRELPLEYLGHLFEQYVGLEIIRYMRAINQRFSLKYWRDPSGPEVDWVLEINDQYVPIEVKWTETPTISDAKHLQTFINEYSKAKKGFVICRTPLAMKLSSTVTALPWENLYAMISHLLSV